MRSTTRLLVALTLLLLPACKPAGGGGSGGAASSAGNTTNCTALATTPLSLECKLTFSVPASLVGSPAPLARCTRGAFLTTAGSATGTDTTIWGFAGEDEPGSKVRLRSVVLDGVFTTSVAPVNALDSSCTTTAGPAAPLRLVWTVTHIARVDRQTVPNCVFQSAITFSDSTVTPVGNLPNGSLDAAVRARVFVMMDSLVADRVDLITRGASRSPGGGPGRCGDWAPLPPGV